CARWGSEDDNVYLDLYFDSW
nr:immunoglobulin heavy chain junction region [Macaca mulatta]